MKKKLFSNGDGGGYGGSDCLRDAAVRKTTRTRSRAASQILNFWDYPWISSLKAG